MRGTDILLVTGAVIGGVAILASAYGGALRAGAAPHERWATGECATCHAAGDDAVAVEVPADHEQAMFLATHGRADATGTARCTSCHAPSACRDCHAAPPGSHTAGFTRPSGHDAGGLRHAMLGRLRPSSCLSCHRAPVVQCATCHAADEVRAWIDRAKSDSSSWPAEIWVAP